MNLFELIIQSASRAYDSWQADAGLRVAVQQTLEEAIAQGWIMPDLSEIRVAPQLNSYFSCGQRVLNFCGDLSERLGLRYPAVDWGVANADKARCLDFLRLFLDERVRQPLSWQTTFGDLILGSLNASFESATPNGETLTAARVFLLEQTGEQASNLAKWARMGNRAFVKFIVDTVFEVSSSRSPDDHMQHLSGVLGCDEITTTSNSIVVYYLTRLFNLSLSFSRAAAPRAIWPDQRWDRVNAGGQQLHEFLDYYLASANKHESLRIELGPLILCSLDSVLEEEPLPQDTWSKAEKFVRWRSVEFSTFKTEMEHGGYGMVREFVQQVLSDCRPRKTRVVSTK